METKDSSALNGHVSHHLVWISACLLAGTVLWNAQAGDWADCLYLLGLGIGGALLVSARAPKRTSESTWVLPVIRWTGIVLVTLIVLAQLFLLARFLLVA